MITGDSRQGAFMNRKFALRPLAVAIAAAALTLPLSANAQNWMVGLRVLNINPDVSTSISGLDVSDAWTGEIDLSYFFTPNVAVELVATWAKHEVTLNGNSLGKVGLLPPTLTLQYHFTQFGAFKPYVGGGFNYTYFYENTLANDTLYVDANSWGGALQAGFDYQIQRNWYFNADVKYLWISTDVYTKATNTNLGSLDINPWVFGVGVRYRF
jgi:outer membrane protein